MATRLEVHTTVLPGNRIEIQAPELTVGRPATVLITLNDEGPPKRPFWEVVGDYPGRQLFKSVEEVEAYLLAERETWDG